MEPCLDPDSSRNGGSRRSEIWLFGGLVGLGLVVSGFLWTEIGSVRTELRTEIRENRDAISANRDAIAELAEGQARIEAILEERLPRDR